MGIRLLNTEGRKCWHGIKIVAAGEVVGRIMALTVADHEELDRIARIVGMPTLEGFSMGCAVKAKECAICGEEWDDEDSEHGR